MTFFISESCKATLGKVATPAYVADVARLKKNMAVAARIRKETGCKILLATKAFAMPAMFPFMRETLDGTTASGLYEARLGKEEFGKEVHVFSPAFTDNALHDVMAYADHIYFNSVEQIRQFLPLVKAAGKKVGLRVNPGYSHATLGGDLYDPCSPRSRFGVLPGELKHVPLDNIDVLHFHALCESLHDGSVGLIEHVAKELTPYIQCVKAVNFGGGHFIGKASYDGDALIKAINNFRDIFEVDVILEPGSGLVVDAGYLVATVLDIIERDIPIAVLDASASCHMPDVLEVPYTPPLMEADKPNVLPHTYILGGNTCMTGDIIGEYSFEKPLIFGDKLIFGDMLQYSFVKNNTFNGTPLPDLAVLHEDGRYEVVKKFGYEDFKGRLA